MNRKSPVRHAVRSYHRGKTLVRKYMRGHGTKSAKNRSSPRYLMPRNYRVLSPTESHKYLKYVEKGLHNGLRVNKHPGSVNLNLMTIRRSELDPMISLRPDFEDAVRYHMDEIRNGKTVSPILVHKLPNGRFAILDGLARVEAYKRVGINEYPAVENSDVSTFTDVGYEVGKGTSRYGDEVTQMAIDYGETNNGKPSSYLIGNLIYEMNRYRKRYGDETLKMALDYAATNNIKVTSDNIGNLIYAIGQNKKKYGKKSTQMSIDYLESGKEPQY